MIIECYNSVNGYACDHLILAHMVQQFHSASSETVVCTVTQGRGGAHCFLRFRWMNFYEKMAQAHAQRLKISRVVNCKIGFQNTAENNKPQARAPVSDCHSHNNQSSRAHKPLKNEAFQMTVLLSLGRAQFDITKCYNVREELGHYLRGECSKECGRACRLIYKLVQNGESFCRFCCEHQFYIGR